MSEYRIQQKYNVPGTNLQLQIDLKRGEVILYDTKNPERFGKGPMGIKVLAMGPAELAGVATSLSEGKVPDDLVEKIENSGYNDTINMGGA